MAIANLVVRISADIAEFDKKLASAASGLKRAGSDLTSIGKNLTTGITLPLVAVAGTAAKAAIDFESSFAGIRKTVSASEEQFAKLAQGMRDLAKTIPVNVNELNKLGESAGQLGIPTEKVLDFTKTMALLGVTTNLTANEAADAVARIQNIFGAAGQNTDRLASTLVALGNAGASTEKEIVEMSLRIAGAGHTVGLTQAQVLGFASTLASVGINAEAGGSAISRTFLKINDAVEKGGSHLAEFAKVAGMSAGAFKQAFHEDAAGATTAFIEGLARIKEQGGNVNGVLEGLIGKNIILKDTLLRVSGAGSLLRDQLALGNKAWSDNTALTKEAEQRFKTTASQLILLKNNVMDVAITLGQAMLPALNDIVKGAKPLVQSLADMAGGFKQLPEPVKEVTLAFIGLLAAAGPIVWVAGKIAGAWSSLLTILRFIPVALGALSAALLAVVAGMTGVSTGMTGLTGALFLVQGAAAAIVTPFVAFVAALGGLVFALPKAVDGLKNISAALKEGRLWQFLTTKDAPNIWERWFKDTGQAAKDATGHLITFGQHIPDINLSPEKPKPAVAGGGGVGDLSDGEKEAKKFARAVKDLSDQINGVDLIKKAREWEAALRSTGSVAKLLADRDLRAQLGTVLDDLVTKFGSLKKAGVGALEPVHDSILALTGGVPGYIQALDKITERVRKLHDLGPGDLLANVSKPVAPPPIPSGPELADFDFHKLLFTAKPKPPPISFWEQWFPSKDIGAALGNAFNGAMTDKSGVLGFVKLGAANVAQAFADDFVGSKDKIRNGIGNAINLAMKGIASGVKPVEAIGSAIGQSFTTGLAKKLTSSIAEGGLAIGGFLGGAINTVLPGLGSLLGPLVGKITGALKNAFGLGTAGRDIVKEFATSMGGFDALHSKLLALGAAGEALWIKFTQGVGKNNPTQAKAAIDAINSALGVEAARLKDINDAADLQATRFKNAQAVLDEYGISIEQTGDAFRNANLASAFDVLFEKTQTLVAVGVDYNLILEKQADQYSELAKRAIATNTEIPASMRPLLEKLAEMGLLTDKVTGEFIDLSQVKWAQTLTEGFKSVTDAINRMIEALDRAGTRRLPAPPEEPDVPHLARGGIVRRPTLALIGESGPEAVVPLTRSGMGLGTASVGGDTYVYIGNEAVDQHLVRVARQDAARGGLRTRAASGRSY